VLEDVLKTFMRAVLYLCHFCVVRYFKSSHVLDYIFNSELVYDLGASLHLFLHFCVTGFYLLNIFSLHCVGKNVC